MKLHEFRGSGDKWDRKNLRNSVATPKHTEILSKHMLIYGKLSWNIRWLVGNFVRVSKDTIIGIFEKRILENFHIKFGHFYQTSKMSSQLEFLPEIIRVAEI